MSIRGSDSEGFSKMPTTSGAHPLTRYVMNFLVFLTNYSSPISDIVADSSMNVQISPASLWAAERSRQLQQLALDLRG